MTARPAIPLFAFQDSSITNLQALSDSAAFLGTTPMGWHLFKLFDQGPLTAGANTQILFSSSAFDPDGVSGANDAKVQTRGYYDCEATLPFSNTAAAGKSCLAFFKVVTGANNPLGAGVAIQFGGLADLTTGNADEMSLTCFGTSPCLYPNDEVQVWLKVTVTGVTVNHAWDTSGNNDLGGFADGGPYFTGQWVSEGP